MLKYIIFLSLTIALVAVAVVSGCSGGGGSAAKSMLRGVASIHSDAVAPRIGLLYISGGAFATYSSASMPQSASGWSDVNWAIKLPSSGAHSVYSICVFNDVDGNRIYTDYHELLGYPKRNGQYLLLRDNGGTFSVIDGTSFVWFADASKCSGNDIYVNCEFKKTLQGDDPSLAVIEALNDLSQRLKE